MKALFVDSIDFSKPIFGSGGASVATSAIRNCASKFIFVGYLNDNFPEGRVHNVSYDGIAINVFSLGSTTNKLHLYSIPESIKYLIKLLKYESVLKTLGTKNVFTGLYTSLWFFAFQRKHWNICYYAPGLSNPLIVGRRPILGKLFSWIYNKVQFRALANADVIFAAASNVEIDSYKIKEGMPDIEIFSMPTAVNTNIFNIMPVSEARKHFGLTSQSIVFTYVGRLADVKGIPLILESLALLIDKYPECILLIVGDGEKRKELEIAATKLNISDNVKFLGRLEPLKVSLAICSSDVCVVSSYHEGFSVAMLEQISCGKPIVSTNVSGASDVIFPGVNGFIVQDRNPEKFSEKMLEALSLKNVEKVSVDIISSKYTESLLWNNIMTKWVI